jgi:hypothetical protein
MSARAWWACAAIVLARGLVAGVSAGTVTGFLVATAVAPPFGGLVGIFVGALVGLALSATAAPLLAVTHWLMADGFDAGLGGALASAVSAIGWGLALRFPGTLVVIGTLLSVAVGVVIGRWVVLGPSPLVRQDQRV